MTLSALTRLSSRKFDGSGPESFRERGRGSPVGAAVLSVALVTTGDSILR
jgi:hypothetical protein